jgi:hypothetical protein
MMRNATTAPTIVRNTLHPRSEMVPWAITITPTVEHLVRG